MSIVSANYFDALAVHPILGRGFEPAEDSGRNAHPVTVISYQMWKKRFHGDPAIIGKTQIREFRGLGHAALGADVDAGTVRTRRIQTGRSRGAMG